MSSAPEKAAQCSAVLPSYRIRYERGFFSVLVTRRTTSTEFTTNGSSETKDLTTWICPRALSIRGDHSEQEVPTVLRCGLDGDRHLLCGL